MAIHRHGAASHRRQAQSDTPIRASVPGGSASMLLRAEPVQPRWEAHVAEIAAVEETEQEQDACSVYSSRGSAFDDDGISCRTSSSQVQPLQHSNTYCDICSKPIS